MTGFGKLWPVLILGCCFLMPAAARLAAQEKEIKWNVTYRGNEMPTAPWTTQFNIPLEKLKNCVAEVKDGTLLIADRGKEAGQYLYYWYPWAVRPENETIAEAKMKLLSGFCEIVVSNGISTEELQLYPDKVAMNYGRLTCSMNTTDAFHVYRIVIRNHDYKLFVDGDLKIDGAGKYNPVTAYGARNNLEFGAANSPSFGEALWEYVRWATLPSKK